MDANEITVTPFELKRPTTNLATESAIAAQALREAARSLIAASFEAWRDDQLRELSGVDWSASQLLELANNLEGNN